VASIQETGFSTRQSDPQEIIAAFAFNVYHAPVKFDRKVYEEGYQAASVPGKYAADNPYPVGSDEAANWAEGFFDATQTALENQHAQTS
jgi:hypothetical protein